MFSNEDRNPSPLHLRSHEYYFVMNMVRIWLQSSLSVKVAQNDKNINLRPLSITNATSSIVSDVSAMFVLIVQDTRKRVETVRGTN